MWLHGYSKKCMKHLHPAMQPTVLRVTQEEYEELTYEGPKLNYKKNKTFNI